jgi:hypothetical protein
MDRFLLAENPMSESRDLAIIHTIEPVAIIGVLENFEKHHQPHAHFNHFGEEYTLYIHHMFTTNMAGLDEAEGKKMVDKLLKRAWHWFAAYMEWEDQQ